MRERMSERVGAWRAGLAVGALVWGGVLGMGGCESTPRESAGEERVTLQDIAPPVSPAAGLGQGEGEVAVAPSATRYRVARVDISMERPLNPVWAVVDDTVLGPIKTAVWQNNGLRIGKASVGQIDRLEEAIGSRVATRRETMMNLREPAAIRSGASVGRPVPIDLTVPPMNLRQEWTSSGRFRLLMREIAAGPSGVSLELMPHLYRPAASLLPRQPGQDELDGRVFDELVASVNLTPDEVLVIGMHWDWVEVDPVPNFMAEETAEELAEGESEAAGEAAGEVGSDGDEDAGEAAAVRPPRTPEELVAQDDSLILLQAPPLPPSVGSELFAARRAGTPVQVLLLVTVADSNLRIGPPPAGP
ncbi:MAG: hypothetical protein AAF078_02705 [Planctomycetota bacterium]